MATSDPRKLSKNLLTLAWSIEGCAALIGLLLAVSRMFFYDSKEQLPWYLLIQGGLPFIAVSIIELTKIPLAEVFWNTKRIIWKILFLLAIFLTIIITFETFFIGFETYQSIILKPLRPTIVRITSLKDQLNIEEDKLKARSEHTIIDKSDKEHGNTINELSRNAKKFIARKEKEISEIVKSYEDSTKILRERKRNKYAEEKELKQNFKNKRKEFGNDRDKDLKELINPTTIESRANKTITEIDNKITKAKDDAREEKNKIREEQRKLFEESLFGGNHIEKRDELIQKVNKKLNEDLKIFETEKVAVRDKLQKDKDKYFLSRRDIKEDFKEKIDESESQHDRKLITLKKVILDINSRIERENSITTSDKRKIERLRKDIKQITDDERIAINKENKRFVSGKKDLKDTQSKKEALKKQLTPLCKELTNKVYSKAIYRLAMQIHSTENACDLKEEQLSFTKLLWFGSLALIVSCLGTIIALGAFITRDPPSAPKSRRCFRLRLVLLAIRQRLFKSRMITKEVEVEVEKIVEVTKEVPVDKIVFKDVPVEITKKEIVYVPIYSNDPELIGKSGNKE